MKIKFPLEFILLHRKAFLLAFSFFVLSIILYFFLPLTEQEKLILLQSAKSYIQSLSKFMTNKFLMFLTIFLNNSLIFLMIFLSGFLFSIFGLLLFFSQVVIVLAVSSIAVEKLGLLKIVLSMLPHGVFEISAGILSLGCSFILTYLILKKIWYFKQVKIGNDLKTLFKFFFLVIIPLTAFAAFIETFITPLFL